MKDEAEQVVELAPESAPVTLAELDEGAVLPAEASRGQRRKRLLWAALLLLSLLGVAAIGAYFLFAGNRVNLRANRQAAQAAPNGESIKRAAFASLSEALTQPAAAATPLAPAVNIGTGQTADVAMAGVPKAKVLEVAERNGPKVPPPLQPGIAATLAPPPEALMAQSTAKANNATNRAGNANHADKPNSAHSIRFAALPTPEPRATPMAQPSVVKGEPTAARDTRLALHKPLPTPPFGTMLPVRLLGVLFTLRPGALARFELMRDLPTPGGLLKHGTVFIGTVTSGERDRAYLQIKGFVEAMSGAFVRLEGEVLGNDGGAGLRGRKRRMASVWGKVLDRTVQAGTQIGTALLSRGNSSVIVATDPSGMYRIASGRGNGQSYQNGTFVQVAAGAVGFILVTTLPPTESAETNLARTAGLSAAAFDVPDEITDQELAELLAEADPARLRAALPRMPPELRRVAQAVLQELDKP
jgi:hypothetical protein